MVPVIVLSDGYLANGAEPWRVPERRRAPRDPRAFPDRPRPGSSRTRAILRPWHARGRCPGHPGLEHRVGGLEKQDGTGNVNYDPLNHEDMVRLRAAKVEAVSAEVPDVVPAGDPEGELLIVGWGSTHGAITAALSAARTRRPRHRPRAAPLISTRCRGTWERFSSATSRVLVPELNMGQLLWLLRAKYLVDAVGRSKVQGKPFKQVEIETTDRRDAG